MLSRLFGTRAVVPLTTRLETARLSLRAARPDDALALRTLTSRNADHLRPWSPSPAPGHNPLAPDALRSAIDRQREEWLQDRTYALLIELRGTGALIGRITLSQVFRGPLQSAMLGYWIDEAHQGMGLTTEAVEGVISFAFGALKLHRVQAGTLPENAASQRVLTKAGFRQEGYAKNYLRIADRWQDHVIFALTLEDRDDAAEPR